MESESFIPGHFERLPETKRQFVYDGARQELWKAFRRVLTSIEDEKPDVTIGLGDITGGWQECGYTNDLIIDLAENACASIRRMGETYFCVGNHEMGGYSGRRFSSCWSGKSYFSLRRDEQVHKGREKKAG